MESDNAWKLEAIYNDFRDRTVHTICLTHSETKTFRSIVPSQSAIYRPSEGENHIFIDV